jgi:hypothetical protein
MVRGLAPLALPQVWMLPEDQMAMGRKGKGAGAGEDGLFGSWWGGKEVEFAAANSDGPVKNSLPDPRELGIDIPDSWASKEWIEVPHVDIFLAASNGMGLEFDCFFFCGRA